MVKVLITGGLGYLGRCVAEFLATRHYSVYVASRACERPNNLQTNIHYVRMDWSDLHSINRACEGMDYVIHAAGISSSDCFTCPVEAFRFNSLASILLLNSAIKNSVAKIFYFSTAHVYASRLEGNITELSDISNLHPYATSKFAAERAYLYEFHNRRIEGLVLRIPNVFGISSSSSDVQWKLFVNDLCKQAVNDSTLHIHSDSSTTRSFLPISAFLHQIEFCLERPYPQSLKTLPVLNLGLGSSLSLLDMAKIIQEIFESKTSRKTAIESFTSLKSPSFVYSSVHNFLPRLDPDLCLRAEISSIIDYLLVHEPR